MSNEAPVISISDLTLNRGGSRVLEALALEVAAGEVYALLGGNGAGKSTLLLAVLGLLQLESGRITVCGENPATSVDAVRERVAYLPENVALYDHLSARENITYFLGLAEVARSTQELEDALAETGLDRSAWDRPLSSFSKGMRQKTGIALALLRQTRLLLLDEPESGLDPAAAADLNRLLQTLKSRGVGVLMVSHDLFGVADIADRIGVLRDGRIARTFVAESTGDRFDLRALHQVFIGQLDADRVITAPVA